MLFFTGQLNHCAPIPVVEVPTAGDRKGDVKVSWALNPTLPSTVQPGRPGRTWYLQPYGQGEGARRLGPDGSGWRVCRLGNGEQRVVEQKISRLVLQTRPHRAYVLYIYKCSILHRAFIFSRVTDYAFTQSDSSEHEKKVQ